jgi:hypothetical protein
MQRLKRRLIAVLLFAAVLTGLAKLALASDYAARETISRIQAAVGAPVEVKSVDLGFGGSTLTEVKVLETATTTEAPAWTTARAIDADLSLWRLLTNDLGGGVVTLRDVGVTLAFDRDGRLLTQMPVPPEPAGPMPLVRLEGGTFTIRREGVPTETFHNIKLELRTDGERQTLSGTIDDPDWGPWTVSGGRDSLTGPFALILKTAKEVRATMPLLRRAPFVPPSTWRAVEVEGDTPCEVTLRFVPGEPVHYKADLSPHDTTVRVPVIDLQAVGASGRVVIEDNILTLTNVRGNTGGGDLRVGSIMDFRVPDSHTERYTIEVSRLNPRLLPPTWQVPALGSEIAGKADIELSFRDGRLVKTRGQGQGTIRMFPFVRPLSIYMEADGEGFRFGLGKN